LVDLVEVYYLVVELGLKVGYSNLIVDLLVENWEKIVVVELVDLDLVD